MMIMVKLIMMKKMISKNCQLVSSYNNNSFFEDIMNMFDDDEENVLESDRFVSSQTSWEQKSALLLL